MAHLSSDSTQTLIDWCRLYRHIGFMRASLYKVPLKNDEKNAAATAFSWWRGGQWAILIHGRGLRRVKLAELYAVCNICEYFDVFSFPGSIHLLLVIDRIEWCMTSWYVWRHRVGKAGAWGGRRSNLLCCRLRVFLCFVNNLFGDVYESHVLRQHNNTVAATVA